MGSLIGRVLPLALGAAISPTLLVLEILVLSGRTRPVTRAWMVTLGCTIDLAAFTAIGLVFMRQLPAPEHTSGPSPTSGVIRLTVALVLLVLGFRQVVARAGAQDAHRSHTSGRLQSAGLGFFLGVGLVTMALNVTSLVLYIPAVHDIAQSGTGFGAKAVVVAMLFVVTLVPAWLPVLSVSVMGSRARPVLDSLNGFATRHMRQINAAVCFLFAALLAWQGLRALS